MKTRILLRSDIPTIVSRILSSSSSVTSVARSYLEAEAAAEGKKPGRIDRAAMASITMLLGQMRVAMSSGTDYRVVPCFRI